MFNLTVGDQSVTYVKPMKQVNLFIRSSYFNPSADWIIVFLMPSGCTTGLNSSPYLTPPAPLVLILFTFYINSVTQNLPVILDLAPIDQHAP